MARDTIGVVPVAKLVREGGKSGKIISQGSSKGLRLILCGRRELKGIEDSHVATMIYGKQSIEYI